MNWITWIVVALFILVIGKRLLDRRGVANVSVHEIHDRILARDPMTIIDVREPREFNSGHISGAINIPLGTLAQGVGRIPKENEVLLICQSGNRSMTAFHRLKSMGFTDVKNVEGGMLRWAWETV